MLNDHDISNSVWQNACNYYDEKAKYYKCYVLWGYTGEMKNWLGSINLISCSKLRKQLVLPHSDASEERVFSMVKKNKTPFRASMGFNTMKSILIVKLANPNATKFKPDKALLTRIIHYHKKVLKKMMSLFFVQLYIFTYHQISRTSYFRAFIFGAVKQFIYSRRNNFRASTKLIFSRRSKL